MLPVPRLTALGLQTITTNGLKDRIDADKEDFKAAILPRDPQDRREVWERLMEVFFSLEGARRSQYDAFRPLMGITLEQVFRITGAYIAPVIGKEIGR